MKENFAIVLDYLPRGYATSFKKEPIAQTIGEEHFSLLELVVRDDIKIELREKIYIGPDKRDKVQYIKGRLTFDRLTATARNELKSLLDEIVKADEARYVEFFNKAGPISVRTHSLELLPNIGKKHMMDMLDERDKKPFESFKEITERIKLMPDPHRVIIERIMEELQGDSKYYIFVKAPPREFEGERYRRY
jgi:putative nucleotide binding protein